MVRLAQLALLVSAVLAACDAFIPVRPGWVHSLNTPKLGQRCSSCYTTLVHTRSLTSRGASSGDDESESGLPSPPGVVPTGDASPKDPGFAAPPVPPQPRDPGFSNSLSETEDANNESIVTTEYPINLPSYLLLALSSVACIAFIGSIFEVIGPNPQLGYNTTYIIGTLALPTFVFLFYAAIKKGQAEVEEDDAKYSGGF